MPFKMAKLHGMSDERWTVRDKITQYRGLISLYNRDRKKQLLEATKLRRLQWRTIRELRKDCQYFRTYLGNTLYGDKQQLRNTLQHHRAIQLAFQGLWPDRVVEHLSHVNTIKQKELDRLRYRRKLRMELFTNLKFELAELQDRLEAEKANRTKRRMEQVITNQIQNAIVRQNAAATINGTYHHMSAILKKDSLYFDAVLATLREDSRIQCHCVLRAAELGQLASEDLNSIRDEYKHLEKQVKQNMRERDRAVRHLRKTVDELYLQCKLLTRTESDTELKDIGPTESELALPGQLADLEVVMKQVQVATLVPTFDDIFPRMEDQLRQKRRLLHQMERNTGLRDDLLNMRNHGELMLASLKHTMADTTIKYRDEKHQIETEKSSEIIRLHKEKEVIEEQGHMLVSLRLSLQSLYETLSRVRDAPDSDEDDDESSEENFEKKESAVKLPQPMEENVLELLKLVNEKLEKLIGHASKFLDSHTTEIAKIMYQQQIIDKLSRAEFTDTDYYDFPLVAEHEAEDAAVLSRAEVKMRSRQLVEQFEKPLMEFAAPSMTRGMSTSSPGKKWM